MGIIDYAHTHTKEAQMIKLLWLAIIPSLVIAETRPCTMRQDAVYVDVHPDKVIICADDKEIADSELSTSENDFEKLIQDIERVRNLRYPILVLRPGSEKLQRMLLKIIRKYDVDVGIDPWEIERPISREEFVKNPSNFDPRNYLGPGRDAIKAMVQHKMRDVLNCSHRI